MSFLELTPSGLYYRPADVYIDPWRGVPKALITHAHGDHARPGSQQYLCSQQSLGLVKARVYSEAVSGIKYGESLQINEAKVSFHPAGHILGSSQIRFEHRGHVSVISGDYKLGSDATCETFEPVACNLFVSECTFGLPVYHWPEPKSVFREINQWWSQNSQEGKTSVIFAYALGKAQRVLAGLDSSIGPIGTHALMNRFMPFYEQFVDLPRYLRANKHTADQLRGKGLIICPASVQHTPWLERFAPYSVSTASGWMQLSRHRKRSGYDRGFILSDHADWTELFTAIKATGAEEIWTTHGSTKIFARALSEQGYKTRELQTHFVGDLGTFEQQDPAVAQEDQKASE